jgi:repressor of nif and glnA expression
MESPNLLDMLLEAGLTVEPGYGGLATLDDGSNRVTGELQRLRNGALAEAHPGQL